MYLALAGAGSGPPRGRGHTLWKDGFSPDIGAHGCKVFQGLLQERNVSISDGFSSDQSKLMVLKW